MVKCICERILCHCEEALEAAAVVTPAAVHPEVCCAALFPVLLPCTEAIVVHEQKMSEKKKDINLREELVWQPLRLNNAQK